LLIAHHATPARSGVTADRHSAEHVRLIEITRLIPAGRSFRFYLKQTLRSRQMRITRQLGERAPEAILSDPGWFGVLKFENSRNLDPGL